MPPTALWTLPAKPRIEVEDAGEIRVVRVGGNAFAYYHRADLASERLHAVQLAATLPVEATVIAAAFGMHAVSLSRFRARFRSGGAAALMPGKAGPKGPSKLTPRMTVRFAELRAEGISYRAIAKQMSRPGRTVSHVMVALALKQRAAEGEPQLLPLLAVEEPTHAVPEPLPVSAPNSEPAEEQATDEAGPAELAVDEVRSSRYAGCLLLFAGLARLDLWNLLRSLGASVGPARRWGWAETVATVMFSFALRFRSIEDSKNALREDLGVLLGQPRSPGLLTLRTKIAALTASLDPAALSRELFRRYLTLEPVWEGLYYADGHFCPYYGEHPTPKGWDSKRRLAAPGHTDVYVHDARGRALFFLSQPLNDSLGRAIPGLVAEIRQAHGDGPFTLIFDRGGYSGEAFRFLKEQGIGFITYLKGRKARRRYPRQRFHAGWFHFEGKRHSYRVYEKRTRVTGAGTIRTILFRGDEDQQVPVLTNLDETCNAAKVVHCLRLRWRQENSFKFLSQNYAIDQIIQYGADEEAADRMVLNPKRKALKQRIADISREIEILEAQLGRALDENHESRPRTVRGLKIANGRLRQQLDQKRQVLSRLETRLRQTPGQIDAADADKTRSLLREDRRLVVNALKLVAYNAERMLALRFDKHYDRTQDVFSVFRSLLHLPGTVRRSDTNRLEVSLTRPGSAKVAYALQALLDEINAEPPRLLDCGAALHFTLQT